MGDKYQRNRKYLYKAAESTLKINTQHINPGVARKLPIIFGFKQFSSDGKNPFICKSHHGNSLIYIFNTLKVFSQVERHQLEISYPNCHAVPDDQVKRHSLQSLVHQSPNGKLHQLGRSRTTERIIGYFDNPHTNLFQVCLLDLDHKLSGD